MRTCVTVLFCAVSAAALLTITGCKELFADIEEDFSYWAAEPTITGFRAASTAQTSPAGVQCVPSASDAVITLTVRNPKNFSFIMPGSGAPTDIVTFGSGIHDLSGTNPPAVGADYTLTQSGQNTLTLTYRAAFLKRYEQSSANIGASIKLYGTDGRKFNQTYSFNLEANTPPPDPAPVPASDDNHIALFKTHTPDSQGKYYYVLCFKVSGLPGENVLSGVKLHSDLTYVYVSKNGGAETPCPVTLNSAHSDFDIAHSGGTFIAKNDVDELDPAEAANLSGNPQPDNKPSGPWVLYLKTDVQVGGVTAKYGIRLFDGKLYSARAEQTIGKRSLPDPKVFAHADIDNVAAFGVYTEATKIVTPGTIATVDGNDLNGGGAPIGGVSPDGSDETHAIPVYSAYGEAVKLTIKKPGGTDYPAGVTVTGSAEKHSGDSASGDASFTAGQSAVVTLPSPTDAGGQTYYKVVFKATGEGFDDSATRTLYYKVCREIKAVNNLPMWYMLGAAIEKIPLGGAGTVKISGTIKAENIIYPSLPGTPPVSVVNDSAIDVSGKKESGDYPGRTVTLIGDSKTSSILDASNLCSVFSIEFNGKLILKNVTLKKGEDSSGGYGGGISISDNGSSCEMTDTDITNCISSGGMKLGGAVYVRIDGSLTVGSGCVISGNTAPGGKGAGIYVESGGTFNIAGDAKIDEANDVFLEKNADVPYVPSKNAKITVTAPLTGTHTVAKITPEDYIVGVAAVNAASGVDISGYANRFKITDEPNSSPPPSTVPWKLIYSSNNTLVLKANVPITVDGTNSNAWKTLKEAIEAESVEDDDEFIIIGTIKATSAPGNSGVITVRKNISIKKGGTSTPILNANSNGTDRPPTPHRIFTVENGAELTLDGIQLENGDAGTWKGGAILIKEGGKANIKNTFIYGCKARIGGAIYNEGSLSLSLCHIGASGKPNEATSYGGAIYSYYKTFDSENCTILGTDISYNEATTGGGICIIGGKCTIGPKNATLTLIDHNVCSGSSTNEGGGGLYIGTSGVCTIRGGTKISNNSSKNGGGICSSGTLEIEGSSSEKVEIFANSVTGTGMFGKGGGIYQVKGLLKTKHTEIKNNSATEKGGGIYVAGGRCILQDGTILGGGSDDNVVNGTGSNGGGVYVAGGAFVMESDARVVPSTTAVAGKNDVYLMQNQYITLKSALSGAAPVARITPSSYRAGRAVVKGEDYTLTASDTNRFTVTPNGGDEWGIKTDGTLVLNAVTVDGTNPSVKAWEKLIQAVNNVADGGTIIIDGEIKATRLGTAGIDANWGEIRISKNLTIKGKNGESTDILNANKTVGGKQRHRIFNVEDGGELTLEHITLKGGQPTVWEGHGGGMLINSGATVQLTDCCIEDCVAKNGGGIYVAVGASCTLDGVKMQNNTVINGKGSAVYVAKANNNTTTLTLKGNVHIGTNPNSNTICLDYALSGSTIQTAFVSAKSADLSDSSYINIEPEDYIKQSNLDLVKGKDIRWKDSCFHLTNIPTSEGSWSLTYMLGGVTNFNSLALERTRAELTASGTTGDWKALKETIESLSSGGTLKLYGTFNATSGDDSGEIIVRKNLTIDGGSSAVIDADNKCRIFYLQGLLTLKDITLERGDAASSHDTNGGGVYVSNIGELKIEGSTCILPPSTPAAGKNDVYLKVGRTIDIVGVLTGSTPVASITPEYYGYGKQVLGGNITGGTPQNYKKFVVTPNGESPQLYVGSNGKLTHTPSP
ncbi:hypothetical protein [Treponema socranskii]|uniref:hypothetical protein n=1 Tax=Treponema socranskii TaxID=53419 RepID=UPI003D6FAF12